MTVISKAPKIAHIQGYPNCNAGYLSSSCQAVAEALRSMGYTVKTFQRNRPPSRNMVSPLTPVKGDTRMVKFLFERTFPGVTYPNFDVPDPLKKFARRKITHTTLGEALSLDDVIQSSKFIKPSETPKLFTANCLAYIRHHDVSHLPDDTPVLLQEYRSFMSETRFVVSPHTGAVTADPYETSGTIRKLQSVADKIFDAWKDIGPKCYFMDIGLSRHTRTLNWVPTLVEINSVLTAGNLDQDWVNPLLPGQLVATGWKSYARYGERGVF